MYFIGILDGIIFPESPGRPVTTVMLMSVDEPHFIVNEKYFQIFVELPKLASVMPERMTDDSYRCMKTEKKAVSLFEYED